MQPLRIHQFTMSEYLAFEREAESKHEFIDGQIVDMAGGTLNHSLIAMNVGGELRARLKGRCRTLTSDMRVCIRHDRLVSYPDLSVVCGEPEILPEDPNTLVNPTLLVEVLSPSTESYDRGHKAMMFRAMPSLQAYLLVSQTPVQIECWTRRPDGGWAEEVLTDPAATVRLPMLGCEIPAAEFYTGVSVQDRLV